MLKAKTVKGKAKLINGRSVADRWTPQLAKSGHIPIVRAFLQGYSKLKPHVTHGEAMLIIHLMDFKWDSKAPWPGYKTLAKYMGVSVKQVRRLAQSLEGKKYLRRVLRQATTNVYHLDQLFAALEKIQVPKHGKDKRPRSA